jgi:hypothetical protein
VTGASTGTPVDTSYAVSAEDITCVVLAPLALATVCTTLNALLTAMGRTRDGRVQPGMP